MISILAAVIFGVIALLTLLVALGLPLGEFTMGGKYKVLPTKLRIASGISFLLDIFVILVILQVGGHFSIGLNEKFAKGFCFLFAGYLSLNTLMNLFSNSKKEKYVMTPLAAITAVCLWIIAFSS